MPNAEITNYNVLIDSKSFFNQPINDNLKTYENIRKIITGQIIDYKTGCFLDYSYFIEQHKLISIDLRKHEFLYRSKSHTTNYH